MSMTNVPEDAPRSEDGQWWWDGLQWQPVQGAPAATVDNWPLLAQAVTEEADNRLHNLNERIATAVGTFHNDATTQIEHEIRGKTEGAMLDSLFSAVTAVLVVAIPETLIAEVGKEVIKGFVETFKKGADDYASKSASQRVDEAKDEMRRRVDDLYADTKSHADLAQAAAQDLIPSSLAQFIAANPQYRQTSSDQIDSFKLAICDHLGVRDIWPGADITAALWTAFHHDFYRVTARLNFFGMDNDVERLVFLLEKIEPTTNVGQYLASVGGDVLYWERRVRLYHQTYPDQSPNGANALAVIETAMGQPDAGN
jgi:hypothetical protein